MQTTMDASFNINYKLLLMNLKGELPEKTLKKPKIEKTFYPNEAQNWLLNVCAGKLYGCIYGHVDMKYA